MSTNKILVFVPTYNEKDNAPRLIQELLALPLDLDLLFVDDHSPDGTGEILDSIAKKESRLRVHHRQGKLGIGSAHFDGIGLAYDLGYTQLITMDCDFTHPPSYIPKLLAAAKGKTVVVGSRYLQKKSLSDWNLYRKFLTNAGHFMTRTLLGMNYDATGGFRFYRLSEIPRNLFGFIGSQGYSFFFESLYILHLNKFDIGQLPIHLPARTYGSSKMDSKEIFRSLYLLFKTYLKAVLSRESLLFSPPLSEKEVNPSLISDPQVEAWQNYWTPQKRASGLLYDFVAAFYRKFIIRPNLNYFIKLHFVRGAYVLHAGCGSGMVDTDIRDYVNIVALDTSINALQFYKQNNPGKCRTLHGSIFHIPMEDGTMDGIYNLGVMEHFTEIEITTILQEFKRVLKPGGKILMFWPPEFGLSVLFFKTLKYIYKVFSRNSKEVQFHPDEITRLRSHGHALQLVQQSGLGLKDYTFGPRDLFTYSIVVAQKSWNYSDEDIHPNPPTLELNLAQL